MGFKNNSSLFFNKACIVAAMIIALSISFSVYVYYEKKIDHANHLRYTFTQLAGQLRQSSVDLTRMARTYVITGDPRYKKYYHDILDIRNGEKTQPKEYAYAYWDLVLANIQLPQPTDNRAIALLDLMHQAGFTDMDLSKMEKAKSLSDKLAILELEAMKLIESTGPDAEANRAKARQMLHDENYHQIKAEIMQPINTFYSQMDERILAEIHRSEKNALILRIIFIIITLSTFFTLWRFYTTLQSILGGSAEKIHTAILRIGRGDFSTQITIAPGTENSVLSSLSEMQTKLHSLEAKHKQSEEQLRIAAAVFESQEAMMITDVNTTILNVNRAFTEITGYSTEEIVGKTPKLLQSGHQNADFYHTMWETINRTGSWQGEFLDQRKSGEVYPIWLTISAVKNLGGAVSHYISIYSDITAHKETEEKIRELAFYDQLTGLPNRVLLLDRLKQAMMRSARSGNYGALLFIDLDHFKTLNDTLGHDMGDLLLKKVAHRLTNCVRAEDTVARLGGDEFVVMLASLNEGDAATQAKIIGEKILTALNEMYHLNDVAYHCTPSIGATLFKGYKTMIDSLLKQADLAMYKSKESGRNSLHFFDPDMEAVVMKRAALEKDLRNGLQEEQFSLYYQAQITDNNHITGTEVLIRWQHPKRGIVSPAEFIPLAEDTGLILPLGRWIMETACKQLAIWSTQPKMAHLTIAVNVSVRQFHQHDFVDQILTILNDTGANPKRLKLELTESLLTLNIDEISEKMAALKTKGVGFSLDDFGTGYSSLSYLKRLPLDQLKIDQSFVRDVLNDSYDASIAKTIIVLAQNLGLNVIAEGVETKMQQDFLANAGCHEYQGYLYSRPIPLEDFEQFSHNNLKQN